MWYRQKWPNNLVLVRHGESELNAARREAKANGLYRIPVETRDMDVELTDYGVEQSRKTGDYLNSYFPKFDVVITSPYKRARRTADLILEQLSYSPEVVIEERIRESELGILDKLTSKGIEVYYPEEYKRRQREGKYFFRPIAGESKADVSLRAYSFLGTLVREYAKENVLVTSHLVVIGVLRKLLERMSEKEFLKMDESEDIENCSITHYRYKNDGRLPWSHGKLVLELFNYTAY